MQCIPLRTYVPSHHLFEGLFPNVYKMLEVKLFLPFILLWNFENLWRFNSLYIWVINKSNILSLVSLAIHLKLLMACPFSSILSDDWLSSQCLGFFFFYLGHLPFLRYGLHIPPSLTDYSAHQGALAVFLLDYFCSACRGLPPSLMPFVRYLNIFLCLLMRYNELCQTINGAVYYVCVLCRNTTCCWKGDLSLWPLWHNVT